MILPEVKGFGLSKKLQTKLDDLSHQAWIIDTPRPTRHMDIKDIRMSCCLLVHTEGLSYGFPRQGFRQGGGLRIFPPNLFIHPSIVKHASHDPPNGLFTSVVGCLPSWAAS